ncbi:PqqD family protein [Xanthomonas sacchari]|uniref:PqqD family protein n=1 Tax=Xanthomonas sacchari TaxID=56458 RepID=UPI0027D8E25E|nr:PqqD family protein [Xanthomonas sacchari]
MIAQTPGCLAAEMGEELVIMSPQRGLYLSLDPIGRHIWSMLAAPCTLAALCDRLCTDYAGARTTIEADVVALLDTLRDAGAIEIRA